MALFTRWIRWIVLAFTTLLLIGSFGVAGATERHPSPPTPATVELERTYHLQRQQLASLNTLLIRAEHRGVEVAALIERAKAAGKNTASLGQALATYREKIHAARVAWQTAADILKTHAGFSDAGRVTNADQARATVKSARSALEQSYLTLSGAAEILAKALAGFSTK